MGSKTTEGREGAPRAHADFDGENDVIRWVDSATHTPRHTASLSLATSEAPIWIAFGLSGLEGDGAPAVPQGPSATARAWNGHPGFRISEKAPELMLHRFNVSGAPTSALQGGFNWSTERSG